MAKGERSEKKRKTLRGLIVRHLRKMPLRRSRLYTETRAQKKQEIRRGSSLWIRHLDCGSCNGCELELAALENPVYDAPYLGIEFRASPRHADVVVITGPLTRNLVKAAERTVEAMPKPRVVLIGDCAINRGVYDGSYALAAPSEFQKLVGEGDFVATKVSGCPPTPQKILEALLASRKVVESGHRRARGDDTPQEPDRTIR
jgi:Ni,Fe-hydrogenase III small subunit